MGIMRKSKNSMKQADKELIKRRSFPDMSLEEQDDFWSDRE